MRAYLLIHTGSGGRLLDPDLVSRLNACFQLRSSVSYLRETKSEAIKAGERRGRKKADSTYLALPDVLSLGQGHIQRFAVEHAEIQLGNGLGRFLGIAEADEAEAFALAERSLLRLRRLLVLLIAGLVRIGFAGLLVLLVLLPIKRRGQGVAHDFGRRDGAVGREHVPQLLVIDLVVHILDVEVDALVLCGLFDADGLVLASQLLLALVFLLGAADVQLLALEVGFVEVIHRGGGGLVAGKIDEAKSSALARVGVASDGGGRDVAISGEKVPELIVGGAQLDILDVYVGEVGLHLLKLALAVLLRDVVTDVHLLVVEQHAVDVPDRVGGRLGGLVVDEAVAPRAAVFVLRDLAAEDVPKVCEGVVKGFVVDGRVEVLDEDIALTRLAKARIALGPHYPARLSLDDSVVELLQRTFSIVHVVVVDVGVAQRPSCNGVPADADRGDLSDGGEKLKEHRFGDRRFQLSNVQRCRVRMRVRAGRSSRRGSLDVAVGIGCGLGRADIGVDGRGPVGHRTRCVRRRRRAWTIVLRLRSQGQAGHGGKIGRHSDSVMDRKAGR